jgi:phosphorylcholine metabolism protein LicD
MSKVGRPRVAEEDKARPNDILECPLCKETFMRANQTRHRKSKLHKLAEKLTSGKQKGGYNRTNEYKPQKLTNKELRKRLGKNDSDSESDSNTESESEDEYPRKPLNNLLKKRSVQEVYKPKSKTMDIPQKFHNYITENYGTLMFKPEAEDYFNDPNISDEEKVQTIDQVANMQGKY